MLHLFQKKVTIVSPVSGSIVGLDRVNDPVFSKKIVGDGCAVLPEDSTVCSPCDGKLTQIIETNHAFCVESDDGLDLLVHIGLDTVKLKGSGFRRLKEEGARVKSGEPVMQVDFAYLRSQKKEIVTPVLITNMDAVDRFQAVGGKVRAGEKLMTVLLKRRSGSRG